MSSERYVGERRALWHFLSELRPLVVAELGDDTLLRHRIDRALKTGDLEMLRHARRMFHNHPDALKRRLMRGLFEGAAAGEELPAALPDASVPAVDRRDGRPGEAGQVVRFDAFPAAAREDVALAVELDTGRRGAAPVQVMIEPGTLPRSAAEALRQIADWIEHDRRMLSSRHWAVEDKQNGRPDETVDRA